MAGTASRQPTAMTPSDPVAAAASHSVSHHHVPHRLGLASI
jgi:hypothetical protein